MIKYIYITSQQMRGIHINNYIDNRIMLSGRKVKNDAKAISQSNKPKPMIIPHFNYHQQVQPTDEPRAIKQDPHSSQKKRKKRTKTVNINNEQSQKTDKNRMKIPLDQLKKFSISHKKKSNSSSPSKDSDTINMMQTQRKLQPIYQQNQGLGKRSKSAIIKRTKDLRSEQKQKPYGQSKSIGKKQKKKNKPQQSKIKDNIKQKPQPKKSKSKKNLSTVPIKKMSSQLNLSLKKKKVENTSSVITARKTNRPQSKSIIHSVNISKPQSARGYKKIKCSDIKEQMQNKIFQNQKLDLGDHDQYLKELQSIKNSAKSDHVTKMLEQLQKQLNTVGSRKKVHQQLKRLLEKVQAMGTQTNREKQQSLDEDSEYIHSKDNIQYPVDNNMINNIQHNSKNQKFFIQEGYEQIFPQHTDQSKNTSKQNNNKSYQQDNFEYNQIQHCQQPKNQQNNADVQLIQFNPDEDISQQKIHQNNLVMEQISDQNIEGDNINPNYIYERIQGNLRDQQNLDRDNLFDCNRFLQQNPILGRRTNEYIDVNEYQSIKSHQNERQAQIAQLKKFRQQSNKMMEKVKKTNIDTKQQQQKQINNKNQLSSHKKNSLKIQIQEQQQHQKSVSSQKTPKNMQVYSFERYPAPTLNDLKSPKFNEQNINQILKIKQKVQLNHHNKLNQLVNTMFHNNILSPKTHQMQLTILKAQHQKQTEALKNYQKHAEQFSKILNQIRQQKQQINGIEELIREQKWEQARDIVKTNSIKQLQERQKQIPQQQNQQQIRKVLPRQNNKGKYLHQQQYSDEDQQAIYYEGQPSNQASQNNYLYKNSSQLSDNNSDQLNLIKLKHIEQQNSQKNDSQSQQVNTVSNNSIIKIDEDEQQQQNLMNVQSVKKQKGFESNLFFIKQYCIALCQFVRDYYNSQFKKSICEPIQYDLTNLLLAYRTKKDKTPATRINSLFEDLSYHQCFKKAKNPPINQFIFDQFNKTYQGNRYYGKQESQDANLQAIFLKSIFNALNQSVSIQRPGSIYGKPLPWSHSSKHLKNLKNQEKNTISSVSDSEDLIFGIAIARIIQWGSCLCGFIPDTVQLQNTQIDDEYINHIRQTRMALLLEKMLVEQQSEMSIMQLEQTQVKLCLSSIIVQELARQASQQLQTINKKSIIKSIDY